MLVSALKIERGTLDTRGHPVRRPRGADSLRGDTVEVCIAMIRIVMERHELPHFCECAECESLFERTVPPAAMRGILARAVLAVVDEQVRFACSSEGFIGKSGGER